MEKGFPEISVQASSYKNPSQSAAVQLSSGSHIPSIKSFCSLPTLHPLATADKSKQFVAKYGHKEQEEIAPVCKRKQLITTAPSRLTRECRSISLTSLDNILIQLQEVMTIERRCGDQQEPLAASFSNANSLDPSVTIVQIHAQQDSGQGKDKYQLKKY